MASDSHYAQRKLQSNVCIPINNNGLLIINRFDHLPQIESQEMALMPALTAGLSVFALLTMFHYVTVAHISPTVTFGFALGGIFDFKLIIPYILAQALGAVVGATLAMVNRTSWLCRI